MAYLLQQSDYDALVDRQTAHLLRPIPHALWPLHSLRTMFKDPAIQAPATGTVFNDLSTASSYSISEHEVDTD